MSSKIEFRPPTAKEAAGSLCGLVRSESRRYAAAWFLSNYGSDFLLKVKKELSVTKKGREFIVEMETGCYA